MTSKRGRPKKAIPLNPKLPIYKRYIDPVIKPKTNYDINKDQIFETKKQN